MGEPSTYIGANSDRVSETVQVSRVLRPNPEEQMFHHHLTLGIEDTLQMHPLIKDIKTIIRPPVFPETLLNWERKYKRKLPSDLKNYYYSTNGFRLTWNLDHGGELLRVGEMSINSLNQLVPLESNNDISNQATHAHYKFSLMSLGSENNSKQSLGKGTRGGSHHDKACSTETEFKISFAELQRVENEGKLSSTTVQDISKGGNISKNSKTLCLPIEGKAFQLDSSKQAGKGITCLIYLNGSSKVPHRDRQSHHHHTPKKKLNKLRMSDFSQHHQHSTDILLSKSSREGSHSKYFTSESAFNKSFEELEFQEIMNSHISFVSDSDSDNIQIWFLDPSFQWHFIAPTFTHYYRMLLYHLGLPEWEYRFTPYGVSSWAEQMYWLVAPHLLQPVRNQHQESHEKNKNVWSTDYPLEAGKPNPVNNVINMNLFRKKKKDKKTN